MIPDLRPITRADKTGLTLRMNPRLPCCYAPRMRRQNVQQRADHD